MYTFQMVPTSQYYLKAMSLGQLLEARKASGMHIPRTKLGIKEHLDTGVQLTGQLKVTCS